METQEQTLRRWQSDTLEKHPLWLDNMHKLQESRLKGGCRQDCLPHELGDTFFIDFGGRSGYGNRIEKAVACQERDQGVARGPGGSAPQFFMKFRGPQAYLAALHCRIGSVR